jgi:lipopolysaccharide transport system permease protein
MHFSHLKKLVSPGWYKDSILETAQILVTRRELFWEMSKLELRERYAGQVLGLFWAVALPLLTMAVYLFIFAFVFKAKMSVTQNGSSGWGESYALYLLSGLIPWMTLQDVMTRSATAISANASMVKQVVFPLEILPLKVLYPAVINLGVTLAIFILYGLLAYGLPSPLLLALPLVVAVQLVAAAGIALLFSAAGAYLRDMKDMVSVLCFILVYCMPIFFTPGMLPPWAYNIILLNPLSHMVLMYHDILYHGQITSPLSWIVFPLFAAGMWAVGCRTFQTVKHFFGNVL